MNSSESRTAKTAAAISIVFNLICIPSSSSPSARLPCDQPVDERGDRPGEGIHVLACLLQHAEDLHVVVLLVDRGVVLHRISPSAPGSPGRPSCPGSARPWA